MNKKAILDHYCQRVDNLEFLETVPTRVLFGSSCQCIFWSWKSCPRTLCNVDEFSQGLVFIEPCGLPTLCVQLQIKSSQSYILSMLQPEILAWQIEPRVLRIMKCVRSKCTPPPTEMYFRIITGIHWTLAYGIGLTASNCENFVRTCFFCVD